MTRFGIRFDLRNPAFAGISFGDRYDAALGMAEWADRAGLATIVLTEHHGSEDGYLPSPMIMAAAMAARTQRIRIQISAVVAPLHDPLRLAEDLAVVDNISRGRLDVVLVNGYVASEFAMFDRPLPERVRLTTTAVRTLRKAWSGAPFEHGGRLVTVTPPPFQEGGPELLLGGSTEGAARRAARIGDGFQAYDPVVWPFYADELRKLGRPDPGPYRGRGTDVVHLARDPEKGWADLAPFAVHETSSYGRWAAEAGLLSDTGGYRPVADADALRATGQYRVLTPEHLVTELRGKDPDHFLLLHPMIGGLRPALAWESLHLLETEVFPALADCAAPARSVPS